MKSRRILAAVLAPVCALSATAVVASAEATPVTVFEGNVEFDSDWNPTVGGHIKVSTDDVAELKAGDKILITAEPLSTGAEKKITVQSGSWSDVDDIGWPVITEACTTTFELTADQADAFNKKVGDEGATMFVAKGCNVKITKVEYVAAEEETPANSETTSDTTSDTPANSETTSDTTSDTPATSETTSDTTSDTPATSETTSDTTSDTPATSETTSDTTSDTSAETETPGTTDPGATDESTDTLTVEIKVPGKLEGDELNKAIFGDTGYTWADVENAKFTANASTDVFSVQFSTFDGGWYTKGIDTLPTRADEDKWNTEWELTAEDIAAFDTTKNGGGYVKLVNQDEETEFTVTAEITIKKKAAEEDPNNPSTGIALAIAPVVLAGAAAVVVAVNKKRK